MDQNVCDGSVSDGIALLGSMRVMDEGFDDFFWGHKNKYFGCGILGMTIKKLS